MIVKSNGLSYIDKYYLNKIELPNNLNFLRTQYGYSFRYLHYRDRIWDGYTFQWIYHPNFDPIIFRGYLFDGIFLIYSNKVFLLNNNGESRMDDVYIKYPLHVVGYMGNYTTSSDILTLNKQGYVLYKNGDVYYKGELVYCNSQRDNLNDTYPISGGYLVPKDIITDVDVYDIWGNMLGSVTDIGTISVEVE